MIVLKSKINNNFIQYRRIFLNFSINNNNNCKIKKCANIVPSKKIIQFKLQKKILMEKMKNLITKNKI